MNLVSLREGVIFPVVYYVEFSNCLKKKNKERVKKKKLKPSNLSSVPGLLCAFNTNVYFAATSEQICLVTELVLLTQN